MPAEFDTYILSVSYQHFSLDVQLWMYKRVQCVCYYALHFFFCRCTNRDESEYINRMLQKETKRTKKKNVQIDNLTGVFCYSRSTIRHIHGSHQWQRQKWENFTHSHRSAQQSSSSAQWEKTTAEPRGFQRIFLQQVQYARARYPIYMAALLLLCSAMQQQSNRTAKKNFSVVRELLVVFYFHSLFHFG